jgi:hypothetical protein
VIDPLPTGGGPHYYGHFKHLLHKKSSIPSYILHPTSYTYTASYLSLKIKCIKITILKDKRGGCLDLSKAVELGIKEAYDYIRKYCQ